MDKTGIEWTKFVSTEVLIVATLATVATVAMFMSRATFVEWASFTGGLAVNLGVVRNWQKSIKAKSAE